MTRAPRQTFRTKEFAQLAGVTPRALRHYDRLGLLKPQRTAAGYRTYAARDLERLEQIIALRFIGVPLKKIGPITARTSEGLVSALRAQRQVLQDKRHLLDQAINAVGEAERLLDAGQQAEPAIYRRIIEVIEMQNDSEKWHTTYETLIRSKMERLKSLTPEESAALRVEWEGLLEDVRRAIDGGEDPAGPIAQGLADRWLKRLERLMGAPMEPSLVQKAAAYQTTGKWSASAVDKRVWDFMSKALAARA